MWAGLLWAGLACRILLRRCLNKMFPGVLIKGGLIKIFPGSLIGKCLIATCLMRESLIKMAWKLKNLFVGS